MYIIAAISCAMGMIDIILKDTDNLTLLYFIIPSFFVILKRLDTRFDKIEKILKERKDEKLSNTES